MTHLYAYFIRGAAHQALARVSIESVRRADPDAAFVVMTDDDYLPLLATEAVTVDISKASRGMPIMLANLDAQCRVLMKHAQLYQRVTFLDTDILMDEPLPLREAEDIAVTWRDYVNVDEQGEKVQGIAITMPYNYGVISTRMTPETIEAWIWMRERIRRMAPGLRNWYGNQVALAALCGPPPEAGEATNLRAIPWLPTEHGHSLLIRKLPGERWNYTPRALNEPLEGRSVLHFKGGARKFMLAYAQRLGLTWIEAPAEDAA